MFLYINCFISILFLNSSDVKIIKAVLKVLYKFMLPIRYFTYLKFIKHLQVILQFITITNLYRIAELNPISFIFHCQIHLSLIIYFTAIIPFSLKSLICISTSHLMCQNLSKFLYFTCSGIFCFGSVLFFTMNKILQLMAGAP